MNQSTTTRPPPAPRPSRNPSRSARRSAATIPVPAGAAKSSRTATERMHNLASYIDHTILKPTTLLADVDRLCAEAKQYRFAAVCIPPPFVRHAHALLNGSEVKTATVIGFPFGYSAIEAKVSETLLAIVD